MAEQIGLNKNKTGYFSARGKSKDEASKAKLNDAAGLLPHSLQFKSRYSGLTFMILGTAAIPCLMGREANDFLFLEALLMLCWGYCGFLCIAAPYRKKAYQLCLTDQKILTNYTISIIDGIFLTMLIYATGGYSSPCYLAWFPALVAAAYRHKGREMAIVSFLYIALYVGLIALLGQLKIHNVTDLLIRATFMLVTVTLSAFFASFTSTEAASAALVFERMRILTERRDELEMRVEERTQELAKANRALLAEIVERQKATEEMKQAKSLAEAANQAKSQFLANMSHEIRTPLSALLGFVELLAEPSFPEQARQISLAAIKRNGELLSHLIGDVLDLSKIEADRLEVECLPVAISDFLSETVSILKQEATKKGLRFELKELNQLPDTVFTDPTKFRQILINLIGNAIKFTEQGFVKVETRLVKGGHSDNDMIQITVSDSGLGIAFSKQNELFEPFKQLDSSTTRKFGGTGLGLALSKKLALALRGNLFLAVSEAGRGSTFCLRLPVFPGDMTKLGGNLSATAFPRTQLPVQHITSTLLEGYRILIAEDTTDMQVLISLFLSQYGASVEFACNGAEAVERALKYEYDIVLMDIQMPELDGVQAVTLLREKGYVKPIVALTAHALADERALCLEAGFDGYLTKPIERMELFKSIVEYAPKQQELLNLV